MEFDNNKPIYVQIADGMCESILAGHFQSGARIPSVREWSATIGVNPNTVARSYDLLTDKGIIYNKRGIGFFLADDACEIIRTEERRKFIDEELPTFLKRAQLLNINIKELI